MRDLFDFSKKEQVGLLILVSIILTCIVILNYHHVLFPLEKVDASVKEKALITALESAKNPSNETKVQYNKYGKKEDPLPSPIYFDPNTLDSTGYVSLGFSPKQASSINRYFERGGRVNKVEDFKRIYVVNDFMFDRLKDYIRIESVTKVASSQDISDNVESQEKESDEKTLDKPLVVDINNASSEELIALKGIGPIYSKRILSYRDLLGGYYTIDQLYEVYGLKDHTEIIDALRPSLTVDISSIEKIDINRADWKALVKHPYIDDKVANSIIKMRESHGLYRSVDEISESHLISEKLLQKISPYLMVIE
ncbi:MAG: hypothetical protein HKO93_06360 [Flavobacteriales bacterium]|nr:hypothetical protein [Flavobacteriales bacterium]